MTSVDLMRLRLIGSGMAIIAYSLDNIMPLYYGQADIKKAPWAHLKNLHSSAGLAVMTFIL